MARRVGSRLRTKMRKDVEKWLQKRSLAGKYGAARPKMKSKSPVISVPSPAEGALFSMTGVHAQHVEEVFGREIDSARATRYIAQQKVFGGLNHAKSLLKNNSTISETLRNALLKKIAEKIVQMRRDTLFARAAQ